MKWLRTISGRIVVGIVVLWTTFSVVGGYSVWQMNQLGRRLRFVRTAYLETAPTVLKLQFYAGSFLDILEQDRPSLPRATLAKNREWRGQWLVDAHTQLANIVDVPPQLRSSVDRIRQQIVEYQREHSENEKLFAAAFTGDGSGTVAEEARAKLKRSEQRLSNSMKTLHTQMQTWALHLTIQVERTERYARYWTLGLGALATLAAALVTVWAVLTLRPLRRLRDGARQVAGGDYRGRLPVVGGTEVAELAKEFNAMAAALSEREQELVRAERLAAVGKMAAVITHEIRNPLSSIGLNSELLEEEIEKIAAGGSPAEAQALSRAVQKELDRLTVITEEYLRFARLPRPRLERERVNDIVGQLVEFQRGDVEARGMSLESQLDGEVPEVLADENQLRQALINLVRNAADAMNGSGGAVVVSTRRTELGVEILVADQGPGIPEDLHGKIFEPFFSTKDGGTGLGLALTRQIIAEHGGSVAVASSPRGTQITVVLPAAPTA